MFSLSHLFTHWFVVHCELCFMSMKLRCSRINVCMWTIMNNWNNALGDSFLSKTFGTCYLLSNCILIEPTTPKRIEIIWFTNAPFKFYSWYSIFENVEKGSFVMLRSKIIVSPKESVERDRNNEYNLNHWPPELSNVTQDCNLWEKKYPLIDILNKFNWEACSWLDRAYW